MGITSKQNEWENAWVVFWQTLKRIHQEPLERLRDLLDLYPDIDLVTLEEDIPQDLHEAVQAWQDKHYLTSQSAYEQALNLLWWWKLDPDKAKTLEIRPLEVMRTEPGPQPTPPIYKPWHGETRKQYQNRINEYMTLVERTAKAYLHTDYTPNGERYLSRHYEIFIRYLLIGEKQEDIASDLNVSPRNIGKIINKISTHMALLLPVRRGKRGKSTKK
jgi:hypothetical protein